MTTAEFPTAMIAAATGHIINPIPFHHQFFNHLNNYNLQEKNRSNSFLGIKQDDMFELVVKKVPLRRPSRNSKKKKGKKEIKLQHLATNPMGTSIKIRKDGRK